MKRPKLPAKITKQALCTLARIAIAAISTTLYILAIGSLWCAGFIPWFYLLVSTVVTTPLIAGLVWLLLRGKIHRVVRIIAIVVAILAAIVSAYVLRTTSATVSLLGSTQDQPGYQEYYVIAKRDRHISLSTLTTHSFGLSKSDPNNNGVKTELGKLSKTTYGYYDQLANLTVALDTNKTDAIVLTPAYWQLLHDNYSSFYDSARVIAVIKVKVATNTNVQASIDKPFIVYISGIDTYGTISTVSRSDVNILAVVNPKQHKILLVNTPRDYYVQLHGTTGVRDKLTHAGIYGIDMSVATIEDLYHTNISYYTRINFASLTKLVDAVGGVDVNSVYDFSAGGFSFHRGVNHLDGKAALAFSRERHSFTEGDRVRGQNQQRVIEAIVQKISTPSTLVNAPSILDSLSGTFQTNASQSTLNSLIRQEMSSLAHWQFESVSVDGTGTMAPTYSMGSLPLYVMVPDQTTVSGAKQKIASYLQE